MIYLCNAKKQIQIAIISETLFFFRMSCHPQLVLLVAVEKPQREGIHGMSTCNPHAEDEVNIFYHSITSLCAKIYM